MVLDNPPSYDYATGSPSNKGQPPRVEPDSRASGVPKQTLPAPTRAPQVQFVAPTMHHYVHPVTGQHITTVLPPEHPEMICLQQGEHVRRTRFGLLGIMAAIFFFPLGIGLCLLDHHVKCERCGRILEAGMSCG